MYIHDAIEEFLGSKQNSITHATYVWYSRFLGYFDEWTSQHKLTDLTQISAIHVQQFVSACPTINTNTRHARAQIVKGFLSWCSQDEEFGVKEVSKQGTWEI